MSDVGGILYDQDAVYVDVPGVYTRAPDVAVGVGAEANAKRLAAANEAESGEAPLAGTIGRLLLSRLWACV